MRVAGGGGKDSCESILNIPSNIIYCVCTACKSTIVRNNNIIILRIRNFLFLIHSMYVLLKSMHI